MSLLDDPSYWRARATKIRQLAEASADLIYREKLQKLAASYDCPTRRYFALRGPARYLGPDLRPGGRGPFMQLEPHPETRISFAELELDFAAGQATGPYQS